MTDVDHDEMTCSVLLDWHGSKDMVYIWVYIDCFELCGLTLFPIWSLLYTREYDKQCEVRVPQHAGQSKWTLTGTCS